jgi:hypothetical protein
VIWFLACTTSPWTRSTALAPTLHRLDTDQDGRVSAEELAVVAPGVDASWLDTDRNGNFTVEELTAWMDATDPLTFDNRFGRPSVSRAQAAAREGLQPEVRMLMDLFQFLSTELAAADPALPRPHEHQLRLAASTASLSSPQSTAVLDTLRTSYAEAEMTFPPGLEQQ